ncbi:hypothetical protein JOM56_014769 [Amanita muscaria]
MHISQAMLAFAEVGILESDPALRKECQRMTVRERRHRKSREMPKEKEDAAQLQQQQQNGNGNGMMTGRSARANGLELDIRITDPVKLERRLKRQRSEVGGDASTDSHGSEKGDAKRPKLAPGALDRQQDVDELSSAAAINSDGRATRSHLRESRCAKPRRQRVSNPPLSR